jgi:phosphate transport system permease protein
MSQIITSDKPTPQKPWKATPKDRVENIATFFGAIAISILVVGIKVAHTSMVDGQPVRTMHTYFHGLTSMKGKLAYFAVFFFAFLIIDFSVTRIRRGSAAGKDSLFRAIVTMAITVVLFPIFSILISAWARGHKGLNLSLFTHTMKSAAYTDPIGKGGLIQAIVGTVVLVVISMLISVPLGVLTALYLTEIKGRFTRPIKFLVQAMSGVPSIVAGLFILAAVVYPMTKSFNGFEGSLALAILMVPTVARTSEEVLNLIPNDLREAGVALGGTQWRTVAMVVVPAAKSGLVTAIILGVARIAGETAPVVLLTGGNDSINTNPFHGTIASLPFYIWDGLLAGTPESVTRAWAAILVLLVLVLVLFGLARYLGSRKVGK